MLLQWTMLPTDIMISGGSDSRISIWDLNSREGLRHRSELDAEARLTYYIKYPAA
ncbi:hypothetical protein V1515DRAFT_609791 [Lipomyces mesembrius]